MPGKKMDLGILEGLRFSGDYDKVGDKVGLVVKEEYEIRSSDLGDGGESFRLAGLKRCLDQAERTGKSLEAIASERWGSLDRLTQGDPEAIVKAQNYVRQPLPKKRRVKPHFQASNASTSDAAMLREYAGELEAAIRDVEQSKAGRSGVFPRRRSECQSHSSPIKDEVRRETWIGLDPRGSSFGLGSTFNSSNWRQDQAGPRHRQPPRSTKLSAAQVAGRPQPPQGATSGKNEDAAAALRSRVAGAR